jgi:hypothetical protein
MCASSIRGRRNVPAENQGVKMKLNPSDVKYVRYNRGLHLGNQGKLF